LTAHGKRCTINSMKTKKRRGPGRPPLPAALKRSKSIRLPLRLSEHRQITREARKRGMSISELLRSPWCGEEG
jgi:hypothetical protein